MKRITTILLLAIYCLSLPGMAGQANARQLIDPGNIYALVVGISDYENGIDKKSADKGQLANLKYAVEDAKRFYNVLIRAGVPEENIQLLTNNKATKAGILGGLNWLVARSQDSNTSGVIFYYSGHGKGNIPDANGDEAATNKGDSYDEAILTWDTIDLIQNAEKGKIKIQDCVDFLKSLIIDDELAEIYNKIECPAVVIFDCCFSGGILRGSDNFQFKSVKLWEESHTALLAEAAGLIDLTCPPVEIPSNLAFILACQEDQKAVEMFKIGGVFTYWFLEAATTDDRMVEADSNKDRKVTILEAYDFSRVEVRDFTAAQMAKGEGPDAMQDPYIVNPDIAGEFVLAEI